MKTDSLHTVADFLFVRFHNTLIFSVYSTSGNLAIAHIATKGYKDVISFHVIGHLLGYYIPKMLG